MLNKELINFQNDLFIVISKFNEPDQETLEKIKKNYYFDIILRKNNIIYLCQKIPDAEIISTFIDSRNIIESIVLEFLNKKETIIKEDILDYINEINSSDSLKYDEIILKELLEKEILEKINARQQDA